MSLCDPIADMLTIVRNARRAKLGSANVKRSHLTTAILDVLKKERYIYDYKTVDKKHQGKLRVYIAAPEGVDAKPLKRLNDLQRVSRPGLRIYTTAKRMPRILNGLGMCIVSTSKGVMSGRQARHNKLGGEVLAKVW